MDKNCTFFYVLGGEKFSDDETDVGDLRIRIFAVYKLVSFATLIFYVLVFIRKKKELGSFKKAYEKWKSESVFTYLAYPKTRKESDKSSSLNSVEEIMETATRKNKPINIEPEFDRLGSPVEGSSRNCFKRVFISNFYVCKEKIITSIKLNADSITFFLFAILPFINLPLVRIFSMIFMNDCVLGGASGTIIYTLIDMVQGAIEFLNRTFTLGFLSIKPEFMKIGAKNPSQRGGILFFCCRKAYILFVLHLILKLLLAMFLDDPVYEHSYGVTSCMLWIIKCIFLLLFTNYSHARKSIPLTDNDNILKTQKKFFTFQQCLLKYIPNEDTVFKTIVKIMDRGPNISINRQSALNPSEIIENIEKGLKKQCAVADENLKAELKINELQQFKNIRINNGSNPYYPSILLHYMIFIDIPFILISSIFSLSSSTVSLNFGYYFSFVMNIILLILFPWLNFKFLRIKTLFGDESEDSKLKAGYVLIESQSRLLSANKNQKNYISRYSDRSFE